MLAIVIVARNICAVKRAKRRCAGESALEQRHYEVAAGQYRPAMSKAVMEIRKRSKKALMQLQVLHWGKLSRQLQSVVIMGTTVSL